MSPESKIAILKDRAMMFTKARSFFSEKNITEVDTTILSKTAPIDEHIDVMEVEPKEGQKGYLHTSPEYAMKRLLSLGIGDIYQMGHVFRQNEHGRLHNPEFTMAEWYRIGFDFDDFIQETVAFVHLFLGELPSRKQSYRDVFFHATGLDYIQADVPTLLSWIALQGIDLSSKETLDKDALLHLIMSFTVEPNLGKEELLILSDYPASQAALAQTRWRQGEEVAMRFEIYYQGIELANGYFELTDPKEQRKRFNTANRKRALQHKPSLPIDEKFLESLEKGIPECCGVAVGIDRLLQLRHKVSDISQILAFGWDDL